MSESEDEMRQHARMKWNAAVPTGTSGGSFSIPSVDIYSVTISWRQIFQTLKLRKLKS